MKILMFTLCVLMVGATASWGQLKVEIKEETKAMSKGSYNALVMDLPGTNDKDVGKALKKYMKNFKGKTKYDRKSNQYFADNATISEMSDNTIDIIAKLEPKGENGTSLSVWFNLGASYLSSKDYADRYPAGEVFMKNFANLVSADMIKAELKDQEKILKDKEKELKKLEDDKKGFEKSIENDKNSIQKLEANILSSEGDIKKNAGDQSDKDKEIKEQMKLIEDIKSRLNSLK